MARKRDRGGPEEDASSYNWMDTYGDMVTLLLCFFVLLFSFSSMDASKWRDLVQAFTGSPRSTISALDAESIREPAVEGVPGASNKPDLDYNTEEVLNEQFDELFQVIRAYIEDNELMNSLNVSKDEQVISLSFVDHLLFSSGSAAILPSSRAIMDHIINILHTNMDSISMIRIEGHTDNVPISTTQYRDNWDLSTARATNSLRYLFNSGLIDETKLSAVGYGEFQPIDTNATPEGRAKNRRVVFVIQSTQYK